MFNKYWKVIALLFYNLIWNGLCNKHRFFYLLWMSVARPIIISKKAMDDRVPSFVCLGWSGRQLARFLSVIIPESFSSCSHRTNWLRKRKHQEWKTNKLIFYSLLYPQVDRDWNLQHKIDLFPLTKHWSRLIKISYRKI